MARKPTNLPWLHGATGWWCATLNGRRKKLDKDYKAACRKLKAFRTRQKRGEQIGSREWLDATFSELANEYMADVKARKQDATYAAVRYRLLRALRILGATLRVADVRRFHLRQIEREMTLDYSPTSVKDTIAVVQSVFYWAVEMEMLDSMPFAKYRKPKARRRTRVITPEEYKTLLGKADTNFGRVITALRLTGCRPGEVRTLIWEWVDLDCTF
jgi:integrase